MSRKRLAARRAVAELRAMAGLDEPDEVRIAETLGFMARWGLYRELGYRSLAALVEDVLG